MILGTIGYDYFLNDFLTLDVKLFLIIKEKFLIQLLKN